MGNADGVQAACYCLMICISLIVFIIQMATDPPPEPGPSGGVVDNNTTIHSCRHFITVNNVTYPMECGGECKVEDGMCNPEYDGCVGKKYKKILCPNEQPCVYTQSLKSDCEGLCYPDGMCGDKFTSISKGEMEFHLTMSVVYTILCITTLVVVLPQFGIIVDTSKRENLYHWPFFTGVFVIISWSFTIASAVGQDKGGASEYNNRFITMLVFGICFFMFITGFTATKVQNDRANRFSHYKLAAMFTILVIIDIMHCSIGQSQGWLKEIGGLHPYVSKESKCYEEEYLAYVYGMLIFGFFTYALTLVDFIATARQMKHLESIHLFLFQLSIPSFITWILYISFCYNCKDTGITKLYAFGITFVIFYAMFLSFYVYDWLHHHVFNKKHQPTTDDAVAIATVPAIKLEENDTTSNENSDAPPIARAWSEHYEILHEENNPICGTFMNISVLGLLIVGLQFMLVGWYMYVIRERLKSRHL